MTMQNDNDRFAIVDQQVAPYAGRLTFWETGGVVMLDDLRDAWVAEGLDPERLTAREPSLGRALARAAHSVLKGPRQVQRPLGRRNAWELHFEHLDEDADGSKLDRLPVAQGWIEKTADGEERPVVRALDAQLGPEVAAKIMAALPAFRSALRSEDVRNWLRGLVASRAIDGVQVQSRSSFYFVPRAAVETWQKVQRALRVASNGSCRIMTLPAVDAEDMVETVLTAVGAEADEAFRAAEAYLASLETTERGLLGCEARVARAGDKLGRYERLLGRTLPEIGTRLERLTGMLAAARAVGGGAA